MILRVLNWNIVRSIFDAACLFALARYLHLSAVGLWLFVNPNAILLFRAIAGVAASTWGILLY